VKKKTSILLISPIVILVWGFVFYKLFVSFFTTPNYAKPEARQSVSIDEIKKDTFEIVADYRDPFLGKKAKHRHSNSNNKVSNVTKQLTKVEKKTEQPWPSITYKGMIKNNNSDRRVGIATINGKEYLVKKGDEIQGVKLLSIGKVELKVSFQKEKKIITK